MTTGLPFKNGKMLEIANKTYRQVAAEMYMLHVPPLTLFVIATLSYYTLYSTLFYAILVGSLAALLAFTYNEYMHQCLMTEYRARLDIYYSEHPEAYSFRRRSLRLSRRKIEEIPCYTEVEEES